MRILVTGGAGYIGSHTCVELLEAGHDVAQSFADPSEAARLMGWNARFGLEEMCQDAWRWQSMNPHGYGVVP